ncbi:MAG: DUF2238 domain-containing protein [Bryobacteraceae bacterium]
MRQSNTHIWLLSFVLVALLASAIHPFDRTTWILEVFPIILTAPLLIWLWMRPEPARLRFTTLLNTLIALHGLILIVGGHYSYAEVPLFNWLRDQLHMDRNYYDRVGHFAQGFVPAMVAREVLLRKTRVERGAVLTFLCICIAMAISAWYEILEFVSARTLGDSAEHFLGTQGDMWDTQWDMTMCFLGALAAMAFLPRWQDRQLTAPDRKA